jgi:hypothetical protein
MKQIKGRTYNLVSPHIFYQNNLQIYLYLNDQNEFPIPLKQTGNFNDLKIPINLRHIS